MIIRDALKSVSNYPIPARVFEAAALVQGIDLEEQATAVKMTSKGYRLAKADILRWLSTAPATSEMGVSFSFTGEEKRAFKTEADSIVSEVTGKRKSNFGYYGGSL